MIDRFSRVFFRAFLFSPTLAMRESAFARLLREGVEANPGMTEIHHPRPMDTAKGTEASPALNPALHTTSVEIFASPPRAPSSGERSASPVPASAPSEPPLCHSCRQPGHFARSCPSWTGVCFNCHERGHISRDCTKRLTRRSRSLRSLSPPPSQPPGSVSPQDAYAPRVSDHRAPQDAASGSPVHAHATYAAVARNHGPGPTHQSREYPIPSAPSLESSVANAVAAALAPLFEALTCALRAYHPTVYHPSEEEQNWVEGCVDDMDWVTRRVATEKEEAAGRAAVLSSELTASSGFVADAAVWLLRAIGDRDRRRFEEARERSVREATWSLYESVHGVRRDLMTEENTAFVTIVLATRRAVSSGVVRATREPPIEAEEIVARAAILSLELAAFSLVMTSVASSLGHAAAARDLRSRASLRLAGSRSFLDAEASARCSLAADEAAVFLDVLLAPHTHCWPHTSFTFAPVQRGRFLLRALEDSCSEGLFKLVFAEVSLPENAERCGIRLREGAEFTEILSDWTVFFRDQARFVLETESLEVTQLRGLLALPVQEIPRAVGPAPGRSTQTPKGWKSSRASDARSIMEYTPHSDPTGPAPETPAVLWAMRQIEEYERFESSDRFKTKALEKELWLRMFEGHEDIVKHRAAEAARVAESRRDRVSLAHAVARGEVLVGLVDTEKAQRNFLRYEEECARAADIHGRRVNRSDALMFHRPSWMSLIAETCPPLNRLSQEEYFEQCWEPPQLDVADGDFVRWCEEAEESFRRVLIYEWEDGHPERDHEFCDESRDGSDNGSERSEDGEPTQKSTHAPAYLSNKCGEVFDDCDGEL